MIKFIMPLPGVMINIESIKRDGSTVLFTNDGEILKKVYLKYGKILLDRPDLHPKYIVKGHPNGGFDRYRNIKEYELSLKRNNKEALNKGISSIEREDGTLPYVMEFETEEDAKLFLEVYIMGDEDEYYY